MFANLFRNPNRTARKVARSTQLSVETLEGRALPSALGMTGGEIVRIAGYLKGEGIPMVIGGNGGASHVASIDNFIKLHQGEEIPQ